MNKTLKEWVNLLSEKEAEGRKETFLQDENNFKSSKNANLMKKIEIIKFEFIFIFF